MTPAKKARKALGMTIYEVADKVDISAASVSRIEREKQTATTENASALAGVLGITEEQILYPERFPQK